MTAEIWVYSLASVLIVSLISLIGVIALSIKADKLKKLLIYLVSFSAGALFGGAFLHLLPEIAEEKGLSLELSFIILGGIALFFAVEKLVHWRHCHVPSSKVHIHNFAIMNLIGDGLHNFLDGLIIGASYLISIPTGIATTLAVAIHEIPQEIGDFGVLIHGGFSKAKALAMNFFSATIAVAGVVVSVALSSQIENIQYIIVPIAIGGFVYIAGSDLIPELHKHEAKIKSSLLQLLAFVFGILVMAGLLLLE
jgi:zinc and cadmium transporter